MKFLPLSPENIDTLQYLAREIWDEHYSKILPQEQIVYMLELFYSRVRIEREIQNGIIWEMMFNEDNEAIGYHSCKLEFEKLYISKLYLRADIRGKGLGKQTIEHIKKIAENNGKKCMYLNVNKYNTDSIAFYQHIGFIKVDQGVFPIGNGFFMDDYILEYRL